MIIELLAATLLMIGATLTLLAAVGVLRMPDVFTRMQSSTKAATLGLDCLLAGLVVLNPTTEFVIRAGSIAAFVMLTTPVAAHVIARAAARTGSPLWLGTKVDERPVEPLESSETEPPVAIVAASTPAEKSTRD
ncbi:MAG TPA: monovalent cation/H(+) antiporter subunit G [Longimicrobiaceae bacterium]